MTLSSRSPVPEQADAYVKLVSVKSLTTGNSPLKNRRVLQAMDHPLPAEAQAGGSAALDRGQIFASDDHGDLDGGAPDLTKNPAHTPWLLY